MIAERMAAAGTLAMWQTISRMPDAAAYRTMESIFALQRARGGKTVQRLRETFSPIVGEAELESTITEAFRWYGRYWAETFRLPRISSQALSDRFRCEGCENIEAALGAGNGAVLATLHQGNWDAGGRWVADRWPLVAVAEVLRPRAMFERFLEHRRELGMVIEPLEKGGDVTKRCIQHVENNRLVALLSDRDLSGKGVPVRFFGETAKMAAGPAVIAARTGAPILPAVIFQRDDGTFDALVRPPVEGPADSSPTQIEAVTQRIADEYARFIEMEPAQWHMFQRFWPDRT
ncbi:MAG: phosphatidylinositol mannoside acyltransferase [Actinomycetota bacterium]